MTTQHEWHGVGTAQGSARDRPDGPADSGHLSRRAMMTAWTLQILLGIAIAGSGASKLVGDPVMVEMFDDIGAGLWLRLAVGICEVAGAVGLLLPRLRALVALCLVALLLGASITNVTVLHTSPLFRARLGGRGTDHPGPAPA